MRSRLALAIVATVLMLVPGPAAAFPSASATAQATPLHSATATLAVAYSNCYYNAGGVRECDIVWTLGLAVQGQGGCGRAWAPAEWSPGETPLNVPTVCSPIGASGTSASSSWIMYFHPGGGSFDLNIRARVCSSVQGAAERCVDTPTVTHRVGP